MMEDSSIFIKWVFFKFEECGFGFEQELEILILQMEIEFSDHYQTENPMQTRNKAQSKGKN